MARRKCRRRFASTEEDPMAGTANLVDAMLVIAVGLLVFLIISWNMQGVVMEQANPQTSDKVAKVAKNKNFFLMLLCFTCIFYL